MNEQEQRVIQALVDNQIRLMNPGTSPNNEWDKRSAELQRRLDAIIFTGKPLGEYGSTKPRSVEEKRKNALARKMMDNAEIAPTKKLSDEVKEALAEEDLIRVAMAPLPDDKPPILTDILITILENQLTLLRRSDSAIENSGYREAVALLRGLKALKKLNGNEGGYSRLVRFLQGPPSVKTESEDEPTRNEELHTAWQEIMDAWNNTDLPSPKEFSECKVSKQFYNRMQSLSDTFYTEGGG